MEVQTEWIYCPICGNKTRDKIRGKTIRSTVRNAKGKV